MGIDSLVKGKGIFENCLYVFAKFRHVENFIKTIAEVGDEFKDPEAEKLMISAFGFGFVIGLHMNTDKMHRELDEIEERKESYVLLLHINELKRKMRELGLFPPEVS